MRAAAAVGHSGGRSGRHPPAAGGEPDAPRGDDADQQGGALIIAGTPLWVALEGIDCPSDGDPKTEDECFEDKDL